MKRAKEEYVLLPIRFRVARANTEETEAAAFWHKVTTSKSHKAARTVSVADLALSL